MTEEQTNVNATGQGAEDQVQDQTQETELGGNFAADDQTGAESGEEQGNEEGKEKQPPEGTEGEEDKGKKEGKEENELFGKPETYDYKDVKLPDNMQLDEAMTGKFNEYAAKLNLSQKGANDLMAMAVDLTEQTQKKTVEAIGKLQEAKIEGYKQLLNSDKEVGGANLKESIATANVAYDAFFKDEDLRVLLAEGGLNVHPKFIKALKAIGSQMKNDTIHTSGNPTETPKSREDILYPTMNEDKE
jgi:hypothetical protein